MFRFFRRLFRRRPVPSLLSPRRARRRAKIELRFAAVYAMVPTSRREAIIRHYQSRHGCSRHHAMAYAIDDRASDEARWA